MSQLILTRGNRFQRSFLTRMIAKMQMGSYFLLFSLIVFVALITIITLIFSARQVTKGYLLNSLDHEHQELVRISEKKEMQISEVRSLKYIENSAHVARMRKPDMISYVNGETAIASR